MGIVNGSHDAAKLQDMLDGFIKKFVLCENCDNPETDIKAYIKKGILTATCRACGHTSQLDMRHKLTTFMLKNPPGTKLNDSGTSLTERKDKKSKRKEEETNGGNNGNHDANNAGSNEDDNADDDDNWTTDVSEEAVKKRMKDLSMGVKGLAMDSDIEKTETERLNIFYEFVKAKVQSKAKLEVNDEKEIVTEAERLEVTNKAPIVLCELIFDKTIETYKEALLPKTALILKAFYDHDILDEEVILEWGKKSEQEVCKQGTI